MNVDHYDRFSNLIEVGDTILRPIWARLQEEKVVKITDKGIYVDACRYKYNHSIKGIEKILFIKRICVKGHQPEINFINVTKLNNNLNKKYD
jgi:hypothetical protein